MIWPLRFPSQTLGSLLIGILGSVALHVGDPVWSQAARIEIPVQEQTYSQLVEQARPLVWQQLAQQFGSDPERPFAMVEVFGKRGEAQAPLLLVKISRETWAAQPHPSQMESHTQFFLSALSLLHPPTPAPIEFSPSERRRP